MPICIFTYIWLILVVNVGTYTSPMDPMGWKVRPFFFRGSQGTLGLSSTSLCFGRRGDKNGSCWSGWPRVFGGWVLDVSETLYEMWKQMETMFFAVTFFGCFSDLFTGQVTFISVIKRSFGRSWNMKVRWFLTIQVSFFRGEGKIHQLARRSLKKQWFLL